MPTIKISKATKEKLEELMAQELKQRMDKAKGQAKKQLFVDLIKKRYGITFDTFINTLADRYTKSTR